MKSKIPQASESHTEYRRRSMAEIRSAVESAKSILVVSHLDPDGDALGTQLAFGQYLRDLGKKVHLLRDSAIPDKYQFLPDIDQIVTADSVSGKLHIDTAVVLECPSPERMGTARNFLTDSVTVVNIDHHRDADEFGAVNWIDVTASSVGEMVADYFSEVGYRPGREVATQLYTAILTDTGRFRYQSTSAHTLRVAADLIEFGADPRSICDQVYFSLRPTTIKLIGKVLNHVEFHEFGRICLLSLTRDMFGAAGAEEYESDGIVDYTMFNKGVIVGVLLKETANGSVKLSLRSSDGVNVAAIAAEFGGGGHFNAAGCTIAGTISQARVTILGRLSEALNERR